MENPSGKGIFGSCQRRFIRVLKKFLPHVSQDIFGTIREVVDCHREFPERLCQGFFKIRAHEVTLSPRSAENILPNEVYEPRAEDRKHDKIGVPRVSLPAASVAS